MLKKIIAIIGVITLTSKLYCAGPGTSGAQFLKIAPGPRAVAMGSAYVAIADDAYSSYWNPAGISNLEKISISAMQLNYVLKMKYLYVSGIYPAGFGSIGLYYSAFDSGSIDKYDSSAFSAGSYSAKDSALALTYAKKLEKFAVGVSIKNISSKIDDASTSTIGADIGSLYSLNEKINLGLAVQNLGRKLKFDKEADPLPMNIKIGAGISLLPQLKLGLDVNLPNDNKLWIGAGVEYALMFGADFKFAARAGYRTGIDWGGGLSAGIGVGFKNIAVDLTWVPATDLEENTIRVGLSFAF